MFLINLIHLKSYKLIMVLNLKIIIYRNYAMIVMFYIYQAPFIILKRKDKLKLAIKKSIKLSKYIVIKMFNKKNLKYKNDFNKYVKNIIIKYKLLPDLLDSNFF